MTKQLTIAQPAEIKREAVLDLLRALGLDPMEITQEGVQITGSVVRCRVIARHADGSAVVEGDELVFHDVAIPIVN